MGLTRNKRNVLFTVASFIGVMVMAVIVLCQIASYWKMMGLRGKKAESTARFMTEEVEASEDRGCVSHVCCFFDVTFDGEPGGRIIFLLYDKKAPKTVENFRALTTGEKGVSEKGTILHYKNTTFHRVVQGILVQGGDIIRGNGKEGEVESIYGGRFAHERRNDTFDQKGLLAMGSMGPDHNGSIFFITVAAVEELNGQYVVVGEVIEGMDVVDRINDSVTEEDEYPKFPILISNSGQL